MQLQDKLINVSNVKNAFDLKNFVRRDKGVYYFYSFQFFEFDMYSFRYKYSDGSYGVKYCDKNTDPDIYNAFEELEEFLNKNIMNDGTLDPSALASYKARTIHFTNHTGSPIQFITPNGTTMGNNGEVTEIKNPKDDLYCGCSTPDLKIPKDTVEGKEFDFCKKCRKEYIKKPNTDWARWSNNGYVF